MLWLSFWEFSSLVLRDSSILKLLRQYRLSSRSRAYKHADFAFPAVRMMGNKRLTEKIFGNFIASYESTHNSWVCGIVLILLN